MVVFHTKHKKITAHIGECVFRSAEMRQLVKHINLCQADGDELEQIIQSGLVEPKTSRVQEFVGIEAAIIAAAFYL